MKIFLHAGEKEIKGGERERERDESLYGKSSALLFLTCIMVTPLVKMKASQSHKKNIYINKKSKIQHNSTQLNTDLPISHLGFWGITKGDFFIPLCKVSGVVLANTLQVGPKLEAYFFMTRLS